MGTVCGFKLISGEEILGTLHKDSDKETIVLENPVALVMMRTNDGNRGTFVPYVQSNMEIERLYFPIKHMACLPFEVAPEVANAYIKAHSKLDLSAATSSLIKV